MAEMIWEATSGYRPHEIIIDLAVNKSKPYDQRIHHEGFEIYSSGKGYLVSAGGIQTHYAYGALVTPFEFEMDVPFHFRLKNQDRGAAVPTILMAASGSGQLQRSDFLRIEGSFREWSHDDRDEDFASNTACEQDPEKAGDREGRCSRNLTNDDNICVRKGFACGTDIRVPQSIEDDCVTAPPGADPAWGFIDSKTCPAYKDAPRFFVVIFRRPCPADNEYCRGKWGFFEAIDKPDDASFPDFMQDIVDANPLWQWWLWPPPTETFGTYVSARGDHIGFNAMAHRYDDDTSGILRVNSIEQGDIDDWPLAEGDAITADGEGNITIRSPGREPFPGRIMSIKLDLTDWEDPKYVEIQ
jgi:hypothetical protein